MISAVERGISGLLLDGATKAAKTLNVSLDYLTGLSDDPRPAAALAVLAGRARDEQQAREEEERKREVLERVLRRTEADLERLREALADIEVRHIPLRDIDLAAGAGAVVESEEVVGHLAFSADWLKQRGIDASQASIVRVTGGSMEPTLLEGSSVLVDETKRRRRAGEIFAVRSLDGGVVKRLEKDDRGRWLLVSDNPRYDPVPWGPDDDLVGQVRWTARVL
ncbi:S24 family peptidase [Candidatus Palauibacter sp.]|uniref:S24 family peptidase n=1 Tax=Candidatus Palauibacter sp. TaxID=3101350 RepID=UPI003CC5EA2C